MSFSEERFREHLKQVVSSQTNDSERPLTLSELKELAELMGVSESEWLELMQKAEVSLTTGLRHLKVENYTDAIVSAEEATAINPYIKDGNAILAQSYYKLGIVDQDDELFYKAEQYARMELKNDPLDSVALNVLSAIEQIRKEGKYSGKLIKTIALIAGGIILIFVLLYTCTGNNTPSQEVQAEVYENLDFKRLQGNAKKLEASYIQAIETRNERALELVGRIDNRSLKKEFSSAITDYDFDDIKKSEQEYRLILSEVKSEVRIDNTTRITLEGADNRINVAKKRYVEALALYNNSVEQADNPGTQKPITQR